MSPRWLIATTAALGVWLGSDALRAEEPAPPAPEWWEREQLTGDWGGARADLREAGLDLGARYSSGFWSNVDGGDDTGTRYEGFAELWLEVDLESAVDWRGASVWADWYSYHGGQPSQALVGSSENQAPSANETEDSVRFYELYLQQSFAEERLVARLGQLAADRPFFFSQNADALLNGAFGFFGIERRGELAPFFPLAAPGAYLEARTTDRRWALQAGVYAGEVGQDERDNYGFDWSFDDGVFFAVALRSQRRPFGLRGTYALGLLASTVNLDDFERGGRVKGWLRPFLLVDQMLLEASDTRPGLGFFVHVGWGPQRDRVVTSWSLELGLELTRPFRARPDDVLALGFSQQGFGHDYANAQRADGREVTRSSQVVELTYRLQLTGWLSLQPDLQIFVDPHFSRQDATVLGLRAEIEL